jgi:hypothetical protein
VPINYPLANAMKAGALRKFLITGNFLGKSDASRSLRLAHYSINPTEREGARANNEREQSFPLHEMPFNFAQQLKRKIKNFLARIVKRVNLNWILKLGNFLGVFVWGFLNSFFEFIFIYF